MFELPANDEALTGFETLHADVMTNKQEIVVQIIWTLIGEQSFSIAHRSTGSDPDQSHVFPSSKSTIPQADLETG